MKTTVRACIKVHVQLLHLVQKVSVYLFRFKNFLNRFSVTENVIGETHWKRILNERTATETDTKNKMVKGTKEEVAGRPRSPRQGETVSLPCALVPVTTVAADKRPLFPAKEKKRGV
jgi:hypothetical protein